MFSTSRTASLPVQLNYPKMRKTLLGKVPEGVVSQFGDLSLYDE
jgi:hypothetical protein